MKEHKYLQSARPAGRPARRWLAARRVSVATSGKAPAARHVSPVRQSPRYLAGLVDSWSCGSGEWRAAVVVAVLSDDLVLNLAALSVDREHDLAG